MSKHKSAPRPGIQLKERGKEWIVRRLGVLDVAFENHLDGASPSDSRAHGAGVRGFCHERWKSEIVPHTCLYLEIGHFS